MATYLDNLTYTKFRGTLDLQNMADDFHAQIDALAPPVPADQADRAAPAEPAAPDLEPAVTPPSESSSQQQQQQAAAPSTPASLPPLDSPITAPRLAPPAVLQGAPRGADVVPNQFASGLSYDDALAACGPVAAVALARTYGNDIPVSEALAAAKENGWTQSGGMNGVTNQQKLLKQFGIATHLDANPSQQSIAQDASSGNPVTISTPKHYYFANDYNAQTGQFFVGKSGTAFRTGGGAWMTLDQIRQQGGGINGALFVDNPTVPTPSIAASGTLAPVSTPNRVADVKDGASTSSSPLAQMAADFHKKIDDLGTAAGQAKDNGASTLQQMADAFHKQLDDSLAGIQSPNTGNPVTDALGTGASALGTAVHTVATSPPAEAVGAAARAISPMSSAARTIAGSDQWANEYAAAGGPALEGELQDLQSKRLAGDDSVMPRIKEIGAQLNAINAAISSGQSSADALFNVAERNPNLPALETGANLAGAAIAGPAAGETMPLVTKVIAEALVPGSNLGNILRARQPGEATIDFASGGLGSVLEHLQKYPAETQQQLEDFVQKMSAQGKKAEEIGDNVIGWMRANPPPEVPGAAAVPSAAADIAPATSSAARPPARTAPLPAGESVPPPSRPPGAPPPQGPTQRAPVTMAQAGQSQRPGAAALNELFQPIENLPNGEVKDALKQYAAAVGGQSQGARVVGQTAERTIAESGPMFTAEGVPIESGAAAQAAVEAKARADLNAVLQRNGLNEKTPEIKNILDNIQNPSAIAKTTIGKMALGANAAIKQSLFGLSNMHNYTEGLFAAANGPEVATNYAHAWLSPKFYEGVRYGTMGQDFNRAALAGVTGLIKGIGGSDVEQVAKLATRAVIGGVGGAGAGYEESLRAGDTENAGRNAVLAGFAGAVGAGVVAPKLFSGLFERAVPMAKVTIFKQLTEKGMSAQQAADAVNRTFGGLNYAQMGRSQTLQDALRLLATAPDWNEATVRQLGSAITGQTAGQQYSRRQVAKTVAGSLIASEILSYVLNGKGIQNNEAGHQLEVQVGTDKSGKGIYMGFMPGNLQAYGNLIDKIAGNPAAASVDVGSFATGRLGMYPQIGLDVATGTEYIGGPKAKNELASVASRAAPIGVSSAVQGLEHGVGPQGVLASLLAGPNLRYGSAAYGSGSGPPSSRSAPLPARSRTAPLPARAPSRRAPLPARAPRR